MSERELTGAEFVAALFGKPTASPEPTEPATTASDAAPPPSPESVEPASGGTEFTDMASALRGQSQASKREADRALVASIHPQLEPTETGGDGVEPPNVNAGETAALAACQGNDAALVVSIHGPFDGADEPVQTGSPDFDGGAMPDRRAPRPSSRIELARQGISVSPRDEIGWGPEIMFEDGASLIFPWLEDR